MTELHIVTLTEDGENCGYEIRDENDVMLSDHTSLDEAIEAGTQMAFLSVHHIESLQLRIVPEEQ